MLVIDDSDDLSFITNSSDDDLSSRNSQSEDEEEMTLEEINSQTADLA
jgi:hypothetical protein